MGIYPQKGNATPTPSDLESRHLWGRARRAVLFSLNGISNPSPPKGETFLLQWILHPSSHKGNVLSCIWK